MHVFDGNLALEGFYLGGRIGRFPTSVSVGSGYVPRLISAKFMMRKRLQGVAAGLSRLDPAISPLRAMAVDGDPAYQATVLLTERERRFFQTHVGLKHGDFAGYSIVFSAPTKTAFIDHSDDFERILDSWRWTSPG